MRVVGQTVLFDHPTQVNFLNAALPPDSAKRRAAVAFFVSECRAEEVFDFPLERGAHLRMRLNR